MEKSYKFLGYFFLLIIPVTIAAFYKTYIIEFPNFSPKNNVFIHTHAFIAVMWISIWVTQPFLIVNGHFRIHRALGRLSYFVFPLFILSFVPQIVRVIDEGHTKDIFFPLADSLVMIILYAFAVYNRKQRSKHMRYMIGMVMAFLFPTMSRIGFLLLGMSGFLTQNTIYVLIYLVLGGLILYDKSSKGDFRPYLVSLPFFLAHQLVFNILFYEL